MSERRLRAISCKQCRKQKARCEVLGVSGQCYQCEASGTACSYEDDSRRGEGAFYLDTGHSSTPSSATKPSYIRPRHFWNAPLSALEYLINETVTVADPEDTLRAEVELASSVLHNFLPVSEIDHLLAIFRAFYVPWLNFVPMRGTFIDLVCCTVAIRHVRPSPLLVHLTDETTSRVVTNACQFPLLETIQALLILALWERNTSLRLAVDLAIYMDLPSASAIVTKMKAEGCVGPEVDKYIDHARVWTALMTADTLLCIGSEVEPLSHEPGAHIFPQIGLPFDPSHGRDIRLRMLSDTMTLTAFGIDVVYDPLPGQLELDCAKLEKVLEGLGDVFETILPWSVMETVDQFHNHMLQCIVLLCCGLIAHRRISILRQSFDAQKMKSLQQWLPKAIAKVKGKTDIPGPAHDLLDPGELILTTVLKCAAQYGCELVGTCPDIIFAGIVFAASAIVGPSVFMKNEMGITVHGAGDQLIIQTAAVLEQAATGPNHTAMKASRVIYRMVDNWRKGFTFNGVSAAAGSFAVGDPHGMFTDVGHWARIFAHLGVFPPS